jgi:hypothetical protein
MSCSSLGDHHPPQIINILTVPLLSQAFFSFMCIHSNPSRLIYNNPPKSGPWLLGSQSLPSPYCSLYICSVFSLALCFAISLFVRQPLVHRQHSYLIQTTKFEEVRGRTYLSKKSSPFVSKRRSASAPAKPARSSLAKACWIGWPEK